MIFVDIGGIVDHHSTTKITSHLNSLSDGQQFHQYQQNHLSPHSLNDGQQFPQYQQKSPLTSTH
jgi:hypothetical protein